MHRITDDPLKAKNTTNHLHVIDELRTQAGALTWTHYDTPIHNTFLKVTQKTSLNKQKMPCRMCVPSMTQGFRIGVCS